jgi:photosystem II stability/assembly factor-like uncharacterized protein
MSSTPHLAALLLSLACASALRSQNVDASAWTLELVTQSSGTTALLQAVSPVSERVVWVSGHRGTYARTTDGGASWRAAVVPGGDTLQFRDVHAFDSLTAVLMSAGLGELSRIFRSEDGGRTWKQVFLMDHPAGFLDCMDFADAERGWVYGDAVEGSVYVLATEDGGRTWRRVSPAILPPALEGEGGFAASGTCVDALGERVFITTGAGSRPRLIRSDDRGETWTAVELPLVRGPVAGGTTVTIDAQGIGLALGGAIGDPIPGARVAITRDGGVTWLEGGEPAVEGPIYGAARVPGIEPLTVVAVGPGGVAWSRNGGTGWALAESRPWWAVAFAGPDAGWAVGPGGRIAKIRIGGR